LYNFHPGNSNASTREEGIKNIAENINRAHNDTASGDVVPVLETMASLGNTIGGTFKDIADIIAVSLSFNVTRDHYLTVILARRGQEPYRRLHGHLPRLRCRL
jgi:endonuclease IV